MLPAHPHMAIAHESRPKMMFGSRMASTRFDRPTLLRYKSHVVQESPFMRTYFSKRTYTALQARRVALYALAVVFVFAMALLTHAWFATPHVPTYTALNRAALETLMRPLHTSDGKVALHNIPTTQQRTTQPSSPHAERARSEFKFATPADELGALIGFMAAFASNSLPANIDPMQPLNPDLVLGFDPREESMREEVQEAVRDAWRMNPVVVLSELKTGNPPESREVKSVIQALNLYPDPTIFEVDQRDDVAVARPLLERLTGADDFPVVIIGGIAIRSMDAFRALVQSGGLNELITASGAKINGKRKKQGRKH